LIHPLFPTFECAFKFLIARSIISKGRANFDLARRKLEHTEIEGNLTIARLLRRHAVRAARTGAEQLDFAALKE
jgi:hypothetical protein